jgi:hypothetical protein
MAKARPFSLSTLQDLSNDTKKCFGPCCQALNIRESRRTPNPQLWKCWASPPHLAKVGLRHSPPLEERSMSSLTLRILFITQSFLEIGRIFRNLIVVIKVGFPRKKYLIFMVTTMWLEFGSRKRSACIVLYGSDGEQICE